MSKINDQVTEAVSVLGNFSGQNTTVTYSVSADVTQVTLHGSIIVVHNHTKKRTVINLHGYATNVTVGRINAALTGLGRVERLRIKKGEIVLEPTGAIFSADEPIILH